MDKKTLTILVLGFMAAVLLGLNLNTDRTATASAVINGRDYKAVTTKAQRGGDSLFILDGKTGKMAVFAYDPNTKTVRPKDVRMVKDAFAGW